MSTVLQQHLATQVSMHPEPVLGLAFRLGPLQLELQVITVPEYSPCFEETQLRLKSTIYLGTSGPYLCIMTVTVPQQRFPTLSCSNYIM